MRSLRPTRWLSFAALLSLVLSCSSGTLTLNESTDTTPVVTTSETIGSTTAATTVAPDVAPAPPTTVQFSDLPTVTLDELPPEAFDTLILIRNGGPYPYRQDDGVFQNREGFLPDHPRGHYREYTVDTPGLSHRGARRFVVGDFGEVYYTDDHYESFRELITGVDQ